MPGTITFKPIEANLNRDADLVSKADPYCMYSIGDQKIKGQVCKEGGKHPIWEDSITIAPGSQPMCFVELKDKDILKDDKLGSFEIDLREIESQGRLKKWYPIFHKDRVAGEILMEATYSPEGMGQGAPLQPQGMGFPIQQQGMGVPIQQGMGMGMPIQQQMIKTNIQQQGVPIQQHPHVIDLTPAPGVIQQTQIHTKETLISAPQTNFIQSQALPGYNNYYEEDSYGESLSDQYAREALIRGIDPLGTHLHYYSQPSLVNSNVVGNSQLPQANLGNQIGMNMPPNQF